MTSSANKSSSKDSKNSKLTSKEIREEYFNQLRSWLYTVNSYQCYYNKLQQEILQKKDHQVLKNSNEVPKVVPKVVPNAVPPVPETAETASVEHNQFVGRYKLFLNCI